MISIKRVAFGVLAGVLSACGAAPREEATGLPMMQLEETLRDHVARYPNMQPADLYKLLHQATLGPAHMFMGTASHLETGLTHEVRKMQPAPTPGEREIEIINPGKGLARINLRPFILNGGKIENLARAVARTGHTYRGEEAELQATLDAAAELVEPLGFAFTRDDFLRTARDMKLAGYPSHHHSSVYAQNYEPAYRLVLLAHYQDPEYGGRIDAVDAK
ncbi:MAG: hypothetical protein IPH13_17185 [Planctomycetes bacterium]|nr:hypothetical protein [Planctomycetota bacterium]MCC7169557.1 hypothetical protein [Planctomycetota bacterium]